MQSSLILYVMDYINLLLIMCGSDKDKIKVIQRGKSYVIGNLCQDKLISITFFAFDPRPL